METTIAAPAEALEVRSSQAIERQLKDLEEVKSAYEEYGEDDVAARIGKQSLLHHESALKEELKAARLVESEADAELVLAGEPVRDHSVSARFLGLVLGSFQELTNSIAQALSHLPKTALGPLPRNVVAENRLMVVGWTPSSFGVRFRLPTEVELNQVVESGAREVLDQLTALLSQDSPSTDVLKVIGSPRVKRHYTDLLDTTARYGASLRVRTRFNPYGTLVTTDQARDRVEWLRLVQSTEDMQAVRGSLVGGNIERGRFELRVSEDESYSGQATKAAREQMRGIPFGANVKASVRIITTTHEEFDSEPSVTSILESIEVV